MITNVNGINFWGSPGGTMSQSLSKGSVITSNTTYTTIGSIYLDGQFYRDGDLFNIKSFFSKPTSAFALNDSVEVALFWGTQSTPSTGIQLGYVSFSGDTSSLDRSILFTGGTAQVISVTASLPNDYGDLVEYSQSVTLPFTGGSYSSAYLFLAARNTSVARLKDTVQLEYFIIEPVFYGRSDIKSSTNQGIFLRNGTYSYATGVYVDGTVIPPANGRTDGFGGFDFSGFINDGFGLSGTTSNTIVASIEMTNRVSDFDLIRVDSRVSKVGTNGSWTQRFYYNTVGNTLTGATLISTRSIGSGNTWQHMTRRMLVYDSTGLSSPGTEVINTGGNFFNEYSTAVNMTRSLLLLDWTTRCYLINAIQPASAGDTFSCDYISINTYN